MSDNENISNYAIVNGDGVLVNIVVWNGDTSIWQPPEGFKAVKLLTGRAVGKGDIYNADGTFSRVLADSHVSDSSDGIV